MYFVANLAAGDGAVTLAFLFVSLHCPGIVLGAFMAIVPVVLAGGSGTRLWPATRETAPKQFQSFGSAKSLLAQTLARLGSDVRFAPPVIAAGAGHLESLERELDGVATACLILEPERRNTAPAVAAAALVARDLFGADAMLAIVPSDHDVRDAAALRDALVAASQAASGGRIAIVGIAPRSAETGYGYIELGPVAGSAHAVVRFVEKPDRTAAEGFFANPAFAWNAGIVVATAATLLGEMETHCPSVLAAARKAVDAATKDERTVRLGAAFAEAPSISLDYALLEKCRNIVAVRGDFAWADLGNWAALWSSQAPDAGGNVVSGAVTAQDCRGSFLRSDSGRLVAIGLENVVAIQRGDAVLVAAMNRAQDVGKFAGALDPQTARRERVHRPWGYMDILDAGEGFLVKRLVVKPGAATSLQLHNHRAEHMTVACGTARIAVNDETRDLKIGQSIDIPRGARHRIENPAGDELHMIEVWLGDTLSEDDIVRFEDRYGRC
jgi:mannose-1-phosphate guanylyltransferase/mannose-6-phosphate isomerase